ncbi:hypothetical protein [Streptosporangium sp. NPDC002607]
MLGEPTVVIDGGIISSVGEHAPAGADTVDARGATLLPGLLDAHVHTGEQALALRFGVTTELEMQGTNTRNNWAHITDNDAVADVRSSGMGITPPGGHPSELFPKDFNPREHSERAGGQKPRGGPPLMPFSTTPEEAVAFIPRLVAGGSDYIKFMIDDGSVEGSRGPRGTVRVVTVSRDDPRPLQCRFIKIPGLPAGTCCRVGPDRGAPVTVRMGRQ